MRSMLLAVTVAVSMLSRSAIAQDSFDCGLLGDQEYRMFQTVGASPNVSPVAPVKIKKGKIVVDEVRPLLSDWYKPEGTLGGVIPYKQAQILFSQYQVEGKAKLCSSQRHEDIFGPGETGHHYFLRCLADADQNGQYRAFHRYGELVPYDARTGKTGASSGVTQLDQQLVQPFKLVSTEAAQPNGTFSDRILRTVLYVADLTKNTVTVKITAQATVKMFSQNSDYPYERSPSTEAIVPLKDGEEAVLGSTKIRIARAGSGWTISLPEGLNSEAKLICGGAALETAQTVSVFDAGGIGIHSKKARSQ